MLQFRQLDEERDERQYHSTTLQDVLIMSRFGNPVDPASTSETTETFGSLEGMNDATMNKNQCNDEAFLLQRASLTASLMDPHKVTLQPIVTGTSVLAIKFAGGVLMASDTLGSYGSLARFKHLDRIVSTGKHTLVGASGDYSDFQMILEHLKDVKIEDKCAGDGMEETPRQTLFRLAQLLYARRSKMNPLWNDVVVAGFDPLDGGAVLGTSDKIGTLYEEDFIATGFGLHLALPIMRQYYRPGLSLDEAKSILVSCLKVLFYRDCRTINRITFASVTDQGTVVEPAVTLDTKWDFRAFVNPRD